MAPRKKDEEKSNLFKGKPVKRPPYRTLLARLRFLEQSNDPGHNIEEDKEICDEEFLTHFKLYGELGYFRNEPDFPLALAEYEAALKEERETVPDALPPPEFMPHANTLERRRAWMGARHRPRVGEAWMWIVAMFERGVARRPGLPLSEWEFLKSWLAQNLKRLTKLGKLTYVAHLDEMRVDAFWSKIEDENGKDPDCTRHIDVLRALYARFSKEPGQKTEKDQEEEETACESGEEPTSFADLPAVPAATGTKPNGG